MCRDWNSLNRAVLGAAAVLLLNATPVLANDGGMGVVLPAPAVRADPPLAEPSSQDHAWLALSAERYPFAPRDAVHERRFGEDLADPWRWLEADPRRDHRVADWVARENALSETYLAALPGRDRFAAALRRLYDYPRYSLPRKAGHRYFLTRNSGLMNQSVLVVRDGLGAADRVLVDPNAAAPGTFAIDTWAPSRGGRWLAYGEQHDGSDWRTLRVVDAETGRLLDDRIEHANDTLIAWAGDSGFFYSRYPAPRGDEVPGAPLHDKAVWFHRVGTQQSADEPVYATPDHPDWGHKAQVTSDGRWAVISSEVGTGSRRAIHLIDLATGHAQGRWTVIPLVEAITHDWKLVDGMGASLWFLTNDGAPNYRLVRIDWGAHPRASVVIPEQRGTLEAARIVGDRMILSTLEDGQRVAVVTDLHGRPARAITVSGDGAASGFNGRPGDGETFYQYSSYVQPPAIYRMDLKTGRAEPIAAPAPGFDPADYVVEHLHYPSKDGTQVPLTVVRKRAGAGQPAPTLLYGYGGFDIALTPAYSPFRMAWLQAGGVLAIAAVRGGGELGPAWYEAGRKEHKQASFDDFIAAGEYLLARGIAAPGGLAAQGGSNGGMMVAAVVNQRPDLFAAANPDVGVMDMLRFDRFTQGRQWIDDYGDPAREADWRTLRAYSPYHNIRDGAHYPAILVTTADHDDRVVPAHSFKYAAALQAAAIGDRPHLLRVESDAGHGGGRPLDKVIAGGADVLAFLAAWTGLSPP